MSDLPEPTRGELVQSALSAAIGRANEAATINLLFAIENDLNRIALALEQSNSDRLTEAMRQKYR